MWQGLGLQENVKIPPVILCEGKTSLLPCLCQTIQIEAGDATAPQGGPWCGLTWDGWDLFLIHFAARVSMWGRACGSTPTSVSPICTEKGLSSAMSLGVQSLTTPSAGWKTLTVTCLGCMAGQNGKHKVIDQSDWSLSQLWWSLVHWVCAVYCTSCSSSFLFSDACFAGHRGGCLGGCFAIFYMCFTGHVVTFYVCFGWSPGWSLCLCIAWGDLVHTIKVSHHVCTWFFACLLPWMGHLVVRQE